MSLTAAALLVAASCYLGFQWTVRVLVYPQFAQVGRAEFAEFERAHQRRVSWAVGPLFAGLVLTSAAIALHPPAQASPWLTWAPTALTTVILLVTALGAVPLHSTLSAGFDPAAHRRLLVVDTVRLVAATANAVVALILLAQSGR